MLVCKIRPKSEDSFIHFVQAMNDKKFRYYADFEKNQVIYFDDNPVNFFRTLRIYCEILAVMNENFKDYPFVNEDLNNVFSSFVKDLQTLEANDQDNAVLCAKKMKNISAEFTTKMNETKNKVETAPAHAGTVIQPEVSPIKEEDSAQPEASADKENSVQPEASADIVKNDVQLKASTNKAKKAMQHQISAIEIKNSVQSQASCISALNAIPEDIKRTMGEKELTLFPYIYKGLAAANNPKNNTSNKKVQAFLSTIKFSTDAYIVKMFLALDNVSSITYKNILTSKQFTGKRMFSNQEILTKIRTDFRNWATQNCPNAIENNHLLSFVDILKLYNKFAK